jgi:hypothetical protein
LHFWNEHLSSEGKDDQLFAWGLCLERRIRLSLMLLADNAFAEDESANFAAVHACLTISLTGAERVLRQLGFTITYPQRSLLQRIHDFFENFLVYGLMCAFHLMCSYAIRSPEWVV